MEDRGREGGREKFEERPKVRAKHRWEGVEGESGVTN